MPQPPKSPSPRDAAQRDLDGLVVTMELTLISIIQGIALYFLTETSRAVLINGQIILWPYVLTGLLFVLLFWSRALLHTLTVIRWPLEFGHNFLYIACTFLQAVMFTRIPEPRHWYLIGAIYTAALWLLFVIDMGMIRHRFQDSTSAESPQLLGILRREQLLHITLGMPAVAVFFVASTVAIHQWPEVMIDGGGHVVLALTQLASVIVYMWHTLRFYRQISPLILANRQSG